MDIFSIGWTGTSLWMTRLAWLLMSHCWGLWWSSTSLTQVSWRRSTPGTCSLSRSSGTWQLVNSSAMTTLQLSWPHILFRVRHPNKKKLFVIKLAPIFTPTLIVFIVAFSTSTNQFSISTNPNPNLQILTSLAFCVTCGIFICTLFTFSWVWRLCCWGLSWPHLPLQQEVCTWTRWRLGEENMWQS